MRPLENSRVVGLGFSSGCGKQRRHSTANATSHISNDAALKSLDTYPTTIAEIHDNPLRRPQMSYARTQPSQSSVCHQFEVVLGTLKAASVDSTAASNADWQQLAGDASSARSNRTETAAVGITSVNPTTIARLSETKVLGGYNQRHG